jgi:hypothetical protein
MNLTPTDVRGDYVIYKRDRFIMTEERVLERHSAEGLAPSKTGLADFYRSRPANACCKKFPNRSPNVKEACCSPAKKLDPAGANRVVVTGAGIVTALGAGWKINAEGFRAGRAAFRPVTLFDVSRQRSKIAAEMDLPAELPATKLSPNTIRRLNRASKMLLLAAHEAWSQAGWEAAENLPVVLGTTSGEMSLGEKYLQQASNFRSPKNSSRRASCIIKSSSRDSICATPSVFKARSQPFPTPALPAQTPSATHLKCCGADARKKF